MAIRLKGKVATTGGTVYTVEVHDTTYSGATLDIELRAPGFTLEHHGGEDIFSPIVPSTVTIPFLITDGSRESFITQLQTAEEGRFRVVIRSGTESSSAIFWVGVVTTDNLTVKDAPYPYDAEIMAVDGLQLLSRREYTPSGFNLPILTHLIDLLKICGTSDLFETGGNAVKFLTALLELRPTVASYFDPLTDVKLEGRFYDNTTQTYTAFDYDAEEYLSNLLRSYNARIALTNGAFTIVSLSKYIRSGVGTANVRNFTVSGTETTVNTSFVAIMGANSGNHRVTGWETILLPPVRQVLRPLIFGDGLLISNLPGQGASVYPQGSSTGDTIASYNINNPTLYESGTTFTIEGEASLIAGINSSTYPTGKLRVGIMLRVGSYYCRRMGVVLDQNSPITIPGDEFENVGDQEVYEWETPEEAVWSTVDTDRIQIGSGLINYDAEVIYVGGQPNYLENIPLSFTTPELPADVEGTLTISFITTLVQGDAAVMPSSIKDETPVYVSFRLAVGGGSSASANYTATNANSASESIIEDPVYFGSQLVNAGEIVFNPSEFKNVNGALPDWVTLDITTGKAIHELAVTDIARYRFSAVEVFSGDILVTGSYIPYYKTFVNTDNSRQYAQVSVRYTADQEIYGLELHRCGQDPDNTPTDEVSLINNRNPRQLTGVASNNKLTTTTRRFIRVASSQIADVETDVSNINRTSGTSGGESSILLSYLGDVKISGPSAGQVLEYNDVANRWANVTPSAGGGNLGTTDQTLTADREVDLDSNVLTFVDGSTTKMAISTADGVQVFGNFHVDSGTVAGGAIRLEEADLLGDNYIQLQAPLSVTANVTLTLPDGAGASGQVLSSNGSGVLAWEYRVNKLNPVVQNVLTVERVLAGQIPRVYIKGEDNLGGVFLQVPEDTTDVTLTLPDTTGTSGQVLTTDGAGVMTWENSGGGSSGPIPLTKISGRWMWSSADDGERVMTGSTAYGPFNWYSHSNEPSNTTIRVYSSSHTVNQTSGSMPGFYLTAFGVPLGVDTKKVRVDFNFRVQNAPSGSTWGLSIWGANTPANGTTTSPTFTLRAVSSDITTTSTNSTAFYSGTVTSTGVIANDYILPMFENRSGSLNTTAYIYGQISIYLVD